MAFFRAKRQPDENLALAKLPLQGVHATGSASPSGAASGIANRLSSLDAYRGFVMFLMVAELLRLSQVAKSFPENEVWQWLARNTTHVEWAGCSLHDLIQPSFSFLVGAALPFSITSRRGRGQSFFRMFVHALWRAFLLVALGVFLRSIGQPQTRYTFEDTLSQIGLGYAFLFLLGFCKPWFQAVALAVILVGYWGAFAYYPAPAPDFDHSTIPGVTPEFLEQNPVYTGLAAHWNKNTNLAWEFDQSFLKRFPYAEPFKPNTGGYATLSFIPTLGTMILGLLAGGWLKSGRSAPKKILWLLVAGGASLAAGWALDHFGICPSVKRIWTPAWALFSGGWCFLFLAGFYAIADGLGWRALFFPLIVIGMNSIAIYCMDKLFVSFIAQSFKTHLGQDIFDRLGETWQPLLSGGAVIVVLWLILYWMYRHKVFVRI